MTTRAAAGDWASRAPAPRRAFTPQWLNDLNIAAKLTLAFGLLVMLSFVLGGLSLLDSVRIARAINRVDNFRAPAVLAASRSQADLLRMLSDVHVYLALGDQQFEDRYVTDSRTFEADINQLDALSSQLTDADRARLATLKTAYSQWSPLPDTLFDLRNNQLEREPAYMTLATDGLLRGGTILIDTNTIIEEQAQRPASAAVVSQTVDLAQFQGYFAGTLAGLREYVSTRNLVYRGEYEANSVLAQAAWARVSADKDALTPSQQATLAKVDQNMKAFMLLPAPMFKVLESPDWRTDLALFQTKAVPLADTMSQALDETTAEQQSLLQAELAAGSQALADANRRTLAGGVIGCLLAIAMALAFRGNIAGPVRRLTAVAEQIGAGDLAAQAPVESRDEIGTLARTFNGMTGQLRHTLTQIRKEKKRADDLLGVVIPIGVELSAEHDFNKLLEEIVLQAQSFCRAEAGYLLLRQGDATLQFVIARNEILGQAAGGTSGLEVTSLPLPLHAGARETGWSHPAAQVALQGAPVNIADVYAGDGETYPDLVAFDEEHGYHHQAVLALPLKNSQAEVVGVLELVNVRDPETGQVVSFDTNLQEMMESLSSLASVALEAYIREQGLRKEIQELRIVVDAAQREKQVREIVDTDFFQDLQTKVRTLRGRASRPADDVPGAPAPAGSS